MGWVAQGARGSRLARTGRSRGNSRMQEGGVG